MPSENKKKNYSPTKLHKLPIRNVMPIHSILAIVHLTPLLSCMPSQMHPIPCFRWCWKWDDILNLFQAHILESRLQHKSTLVAIGFFSLVILCEYGVATMGAMPNCFCSNQYEPSPYTLAPTIGCWTSVWNILWPWKYILKLMCIVLHIGFRFTNIRTSH